MAGVWKRDGTIAVTKGSKKVVGTGTTFADPKNAAAKGHLLVMVTGTAVDLYEVDYSESNSVFYLVEAYRGDTGTGKAYAIDTSRTDSIPEFARKLNASLAYYHSQSDMLQQLYTSTDDEIAITAPDGTTHKLIPWPRIMEELGNKYSHENPPPSDGGDGEPSAANKTGYVSESITPAGDTAILDLAKATVFRVTLNTHITQIVFTNASGEEGSSRYATLILRQGTGVNLVSWPENVRWSYGHPPVLSYEKDGEDCITLMNFGTDGYWYGFLTGGWIHV